MHGEGDGVMARELVATMLSQDPDVQQASIEEGLSAALVCFAIDEAMDTGTVVDLEGDWVRIDTN